MFHSSHGRFCLISALAVFLTASLAACERAAQGPEPVASWTFSQLTPNKSVGFQLTESTEGILLVRVEGVETVFETRLLDAAGKVLSAARLPYLRVGPVFHIIKYRQGQGPITVNVLPTHITRNSLVNVQVLAFPAVPGQDTILIDAYRDYVRAIQSTDDESAEVWSARVRHLRAAAAGFARSDDTEAQLWANYLAAYFTYFPLADYKSAIGQARTIQEQARQARFPQIELMAMQLEGQILIERDESDSPEVARNKQTRAQQVLQSAADLAGDVGMEFEQAWAINTRGIGFFYQDLYPEAEQQYQQALDIATAIGDGQLQKLIGGNLALVMERQGDIGGALRALHALNQQLEESGSKSELAHNWSEISRLYQRLYLFPQLIDAQGKALQLWSELDSAEGLGRSMSSLAYGYQAIGNLQRAQSVMLEAIRHMEAANYGRGLREGYRLLAKIYRTDGQFEQMSAARKRQEQYLTSVSHRSWFQYEQGLDALAQYPNEVEKADELFAGAGLLGLETGDTGLQLRSRLQRCVNSVNPVEELCSGPEFHGALEQWLAGAPPSEEFEARYLLAGSYVKLGRYDESLHILNELIDDIQLYRNTLPGVLGAWYWESRSQIFRMYMALNLDHRHAEKRGEQSLLALNRLLNTPGGMDGFAPDESTAGSEVDSNLRILLANLESADIEAGSKIRRAIDRELMSSDVNQRLRGPSPGPGQLVRLFESMPVDSALLAYYFSKQGAWAWMADDSGIEMFHLSESDVATIALGRVRDGLRTIGNMNRDRDLRAAGEILLAPFKTSLPGTIYLLTVGELAGFPFETLRLDGRYFGQDHEVINLLSLAGLPRVGRTEPDNDGWRRILLAGDPLGTGVELPRAAAEIENIARLFEDREITRLTGRDLGPALLQDRRYAEADLFHFASHGQIDFDYPELSRLILSGEDSTGSSAYLTALEIGRVPLSADLVVLSACETSGVNAFSFDRNLGYVSGFLDAGAGAVVASLWPVSDDFAREFMQDFYTSLIQGKSASRALVLAKHRQIAREGPAATLEWPSFQIYVR